MKPWYTVFVKGGHEEYVQEMIHRSFASDLRTLVPRRTVPERKEGIVTLESRKLFPGYVLINSFMTPEIYYRIKQIPRIIRFLHVQLLPQPRLAGSGAYFDQGTISPDSYVTEVRHDEIRRILELLDDQDNIGLSRVLVTNSKVSVIDGPLKGLEGIIKKINKRNARAKIQISFLGNDHFVDVGVEVLQPIGEQT